MANKLPEVKPYTKCRLRLLKMERIKDYLLMEEEYIKNQERMKPQDEKKHSIAKVRTKRGENIYTPCGDCGVDDSG